MSKEEALSRLKALEEKIESGNERLKALSEENERLKGEIKDYLDTIEQLKVVVGQLVDSAAEKEKKIVELEKALGSAEHRMERYNAFVEELSDVVINHPHFREWIEPYIFAKIGATTPSGPKLTAVNIEAEELKVSVEHTERIQELSTKTGLGKIMYVCLKDLEGKPSSESEISDVLQEHGWPTAHSTLAPNLAQLVKQGLLVKMEGKPIRYRSPGKIKVEVKEA